MRVHLGYGQDRPDESATDIGFDGPTLDGVESIESTYYATTITIRFHDPESFEVARRTTGWRTYDDLLRTLEVDVLSPFLVTREPERNGEPAYYAQILFVDDHFVSKLAQARLRDVTRTLGQIQADMA